MNKDPRIAESFGILNLPESANLEQVKAAHRRISRELHPDQLVDKPTLAAVAEEKLKQVNAAYDFLKGHFHDRASDNGSQNSSHQDWRENSSRQSASNKKRGSTESAGRYSQAAGSDRDQTYRGGAKKDWVERMRASLLGRRWPQWVLFPIGFCAVTCFAVLVDQVELKDQDGSKTVTESRKTGQAVARSAPVPRKDGLSEATPLSTARDDQGLPDQSNSRSSQAKPSIASQPPRPVLSQKSQAPRIPAREPAAPQKGGSDYNDPAHIYSAGESGVSMPVPIYKVRPEATALARSSKYGGTVILSLIVGVDGRATDIRVFRPLGMGLDQNAIDAVSQWKFNPGLKDGRAVTVRGTVDVNFDVCGDAGHPCVNGGSVSTTAGEVGHVDDERNQTTKGVYRAGGGVSAPAVLFKVDPEYSEEARNARYSGTVLVSLVVDQSGRPQNIRVVHSLGLGLDEKAMEAVAKWKFKPGMKDDKPVDVQATIEVNFRLCPTCL
jgi:TonB family protein